MLHTLREQRLNSKLYNKTTELILSERQSDKNKDEEQLVLLCFVSPMDLLRKMVCGIDVEEVSTEWGET